MKNKKQFQEWCKLAIWTEAKQINSLWQCEYQWKVYDLVLIGKKKTIELLFNSRSDTKKEFYLFQLDFKNKINKILSNPNNLW